MHLRKAFLSAMAVVLVLVMSALCAMAKEAEYTLRLQTAWPSAFALNELAKHLADQIEAQSKKRIKVEFYTAGQIVPGMEVWDAVDKGIIDAAHVCTCYLVGKSWASGFFCNGPSMPPPTLKVLWMYEGGGNEIADQIFNKYVKVKAFPALVLTEAWAYSNSVINNLDDFRKLKFRASGVRGSTLKNLGLSVVSLPGGEIIPSMQKGVIDAFEYSSLGCDQSFGADQVAKYIYYSPYVNGGTLFLVINQKWWEKLPEDLQKVVRKACYDTTMWSFGYLSVKELKAMQDSEQRNKTQIKWLPESVAKAINESAKELLAEKRKTDPEVQLIMDSIDAFMGKYGKFQQFRSNMY